MTEELDWRRYVRIEGINEPDEAVPSYSEAAPVVLGDPEKPSLRVEPAPTQEEAPAELNWRHYVSIEGITGDEEVTESPSEEPREEGFMDRMGAAFRLYNTPVSVARAMHRTYETLTSEEENFDLHEQMSADDIPEEEYDFYSKCTSRPTYEAEKQRVADKKLLDTGDWIDNIVPVLVAGIADPTNWISIGAAYKAGKWTKRIVDAVISSGAGATIRYATQTGMTSVEIAVETISAGVVTGMLGGLMKTVGSKTVKELTSAIGDYLKGATENAAIAIKKGLGGIEAYQMIAGKAVKLKGICKDALLNSPYYRAIYNECAEYRDIATALLRSNQIITEETRAGAAQVESAEAAVAYFNNKWYGVKQQYDKIYKGVFKNQKLKESEFNDLVYDEIITPSPASHAEVKRAADYVRNFWKEVTNESIKNGVAPEHLADSVNVSVGSKAGKKVAALTAAESKLSAEEITDLAKRSLLSESEEVASGYFPRRYDKESVLKNQSEFEDLLGKSLLKNDPYLGAPELKVRVREITNTVIGDSSTSRHSDGGYEFGGSIGGKFKARTVAIHDEALKSFLVRNPIEIGDSLVRKITGASELNRVAKAKGYEDWQSLLVGYKRKRQLAMSSDLSEAAKSTYMKLTNSNQNELKDIADLIMGTYGHFDNPVLQKTVQSLKIWNCMRQLGCVVVASLCDVAAPISKYGFARTFKTAVTNFAPKSISNRQGWSQVLYATETALSSPRIFGETYQAPTRLRAAGNIFNKLTLLPYWNDFWKNTVAAMHYEDILNASMNPTPKGDLFLRQHRISESSVKLIKTSFAEHGYMMRDNYVLPINRIDNEDLRRTLFTAIHTQTNETITTIGAGDVPKFLRSATGNALLQYKMFPFGYFNNIVLPQLLQKESRNHTTSYLLATAAIAPSVHYLQCKLAGREADISSSGFWLRSLGVGTLIGPMYESVAVLQGVAEAVQQGRAERMFTVVSPMAGLAVDIGYATAGILSEEMTARQERAVASLIPLNNHFLSKIVRNHLRSQTRRTRSRLGD